MKAFRLLCFVTLALVCLGLTVTARPGSAYNPGVATYTWNATVPMYTYGTNAAAIIHQGTIDTTGLVMADFLGRASAVPNAATWGDSGVSVGWDDSFVAGVPPNGANTNGDLLDGLYVQFYYSYSPNEGWWDLGVAAERVVVFTSQDHGPYPAEGLEYRVYGCTTPWNGASCGAQATLTDVYLDGWRPHNATEDANGNGWCSDDVSAVLGLDGSYRYIKLVAWDSTGPYNEPEIDAVAAAPVHYKCYEIAGPSLYLGTQLETQFGLDNVTLMTPTRLCAPALKNGQGDLNLPHLKCYDIRYGHAPGYLVDLTTQFGFEHLDVGPATRVCMPVVKWLALPQGWPVPEVPHHECYEIDGHDPLVPVFLEDQFGPDWVEVHKAMLLCAPALKMGQGSLDFPHLKCYDIWEDPPYIPPTHPWNLTTQFGDELQVQIGPARELCVETAKEAFPVAVGGTVELHAGDSASAAGRGDESGTAVPYAAVAGGSAAALAVAAGAWYARRRRLS